MAFHVANAPRNTPRVNNPDQFRTLVLNANALPLSTAPLSLWGWRSAIEAVFKDRVQVVEEWEGPVIRSPSTTMALPKVVMAKDYIQVKGTPALSRLNCALRDRFCCGYCGKRFRLKDLTFDHVVPRSAGGLSTWDNLLMACRRCNSMKGSEPANYNGERGVVRRGNFVPLARPKAPSHDQLFKIGLEFVPNEIRALFGDWIPASRRKGAPLRIDEVAPKGEWDPAAYWTVELDP